MTIIQLQNSVQSLVVQLQERDAQLYEYQKDMDGSRKVQLEQLKKSELQYQKNKEQWELTITEKNQIIEQLTSKITIFQTNLDKADQDKQKQLTKLTSQIEYLNNLLNQQYTEIENYKGMMNSSKQDAAKVQQLNQEIQNLKILLEQKQKEIEKWQANSNELKIKIEQLISDNSKMVDYEGRIAMITTEFERIQLQLQQKNSEMEELRTKLNQSEFIIIDLRRLEGQNG